MKKIKKKIQFDFSRLFGKIKEECGGNNAFIQQISMSEPTFYKKIAEGAFTQSEIDEMCQVLNISDINIVYYFFVKKVRKS